MIQYNIMDTVFQGWIQKIKMWGFTLRPAYKLAKYCKQEWIQIL